MSTIRSGLRSTARPSASASTSRPSASVLVISTVVPSYVVSTSPGRKDAPPTMFSASAANPVTRIGSSSRAMVSTACTTAAAPAMSSFIVGMLAAGLMVSPPESNVMPLPTSAEVRGGPGGLGRAVVELDQARRSVRSRADAEDAAAAELGELGFVVHLGLDAGDRLRRGHDLVGEDAPASGRPEAC